MGKPMKSRILSIALAISMIAVLFAALPTRGAVTYTGTVITTDSSGIPKTSFLQGEDVYVNVTVMTDGVPSDEQIFVVLQRSNDGHQISSFTTFSDNPVVGVYNSTIAASHLHLTTGHSITGDVQSYNLIVTVYGNQIAEVQIVVRATGLHLSPVPNSPAYWPGEVITATLVVNEAQTAEVFYVQVLNETDVATTLNYTDQTALSGFWTAQFQISQNLPDGTYHMNVRAKADNSIWYTVYFNVRAFDLTINSNRDTFLPGETATISYVVTDLASLSQVASGLLINYSVEYQNKTGNLTWKNGTLPATSNIWSLVLPTNGTAADSIGLFSNIDGAGSVKVTVTAKMSAGDREIESTLYLDVGLLGGSVDMASHNLMPGVTAAVEIVATVAGDDLPGATASVVVMKNGTEVVSAFGISGLTTDQFGDAGYAFTIPSNAVLGTYNYIVKATISKLGYTIQRETQFSVSDSFYLDISWNKAYYVAGEEATVSFQPVLNGQAATVDVIGYTIQTGEQVLASANTTALSVTVTVPAGYSGTIHCDASTHIDGVIVDNSATADVVFAELGLVSRASGYRPGDTLQFEWTIVTSLTSANLTYEIWDGNGLKVASGAPAFAKSGSFEFKVPDANPLIAHSYTAYIAMTSASAGIRTASASVTLVAAQELLVWAESPYATGDFAPGGKVKIHYELAGNVLETRSSIRLHVDADWNTVEFDYVVDKASGTITYTLPKNNPAGPMEISVDAYDAATGAFLGGDTTAIVVNTETSGWDRSIGGMAAIDFVLLVLLIIVIVMLILVPLMKGRMGAPKPPEPEPPADAGKLPPP